jgi:hypothetical protein
VEGESGFLTKKEERDPMPDGWASTGVVVGERAEPTEGNSNSIEFDVEFESPKIFRTHLGMVNRARCKRWGSLIPTGGVARARSGGGGGDGGGLLTAEAALIKIWVRSGNVFACWAALKGSSRSILI